MVVERNAKIGDLVAAQLHQIGYQTVDVRNGDEAVWELRKQWCDLILLDHRVPMGGIKTARLLRLHPKYSTLPIVLGLPPQKAEARQAVLDAQQIGLFHFLPKPFSLPILKKTIHQVLQEKIPAEQPSATQIREEIHALTNLPVMPAAHSKLLLLLNKADNEVDLNQVARTVETDPALSAKVMRTCHSAYFGFQGSLMKQAVAFLGVAVMRKIVQTAVVYSLFSEEQEAQDERFTMEDLWQHSLATGMAMEVVGKADKKKVHFLLGVMHDLGKAIFMYRFPDHYRKVLDLVETEDMSILQAEREMLGITHCECGGELALQWDLPGEVRSALIAHHDPSASSQHRRLAAMVHLADIAVRTMDIGYAGDVLIPKVDDFAKRLQKDMEEIISQKEDFLEQIDSFLGGS